MTKAKTKAIRKAAKPPRLRTRTPPRRPQHCVHGNVLVDPGDVLFMALEDIAVAFSFDVQDVLDLLVEQLCHGSIHVGDDESAIAARIRRILPLVQRNFPRESQRVN